MNAYCNNALGIPVTNECVLDTRRIHFHPEARDDAHTIPAVRPPGKFAIFTMKRVHLSHYLPRER